MALPQTHHSERVATIRRHKKATVAYLFAVHPECLEVTTEIVNRVTGRTLVRAGLDTLPRAPLPGSWAMAVVLCPGDGTEAIADWARRLPRPDARDRIWFYEAPGVETKGAYKAWVAAGHDPDVLRDRFEGWREFNRLFGNDLNERIWRDFRSR